MKIKGLSLLLCLTLLVCSGIRAAPEEPGTDSVDAGSLPPIVLTLFIHDQLDPREVAGMGPDYMEWFIKEVTHITGRRVSVIRITRTPGMTDLGYRQEDGMHAMSEWHKRVLDYIETHNLPLSTKRHKYILVTRHNLAKDVLGMSFGSRGVAIASLKAYNTIGHEVGHLLGATHENAETSFAHGLPCRTLMYPEHTALIANCYVFSDKNRQAIVDYMNDTNQP